MTILLAHGDRIQGTDIILIEGKSIDMANEYIAGMFRGDNGREIVSHLYYGEYSGPLTPMCSGGWQRKYFDENGKLVDWELSIFRGNISPKGMCKICERRAEKNLPPIKTPKAKYNPRNPNHHQSVSYSHNEGQDISDMN